MPSLPCVCLDLNKVCFKKWNSMQIRVSGRKPVSSINVIIKQSDRIVTASENLEREAPVIEMMHAVGKEAAPDSHTACCHICNSEKYTIPE